MDAEKPAEGRSRAQSKTPPYRPKSASQPGTRQQKPLRLRALRREGGAPRQEGLFSGSVIVGNFRETRCFCSRCPGGSVAVCRGRFLIHLLPFDGLRNDGLAGAGCQYVSGRTLTPLPFCGGNDQGTGYVSAIRSTRVTQSTRGRTSECEKTPVPRADS